MRIGRERDVSHALGQVVEAALAPEVAGSPFSLGRQSGTRRAAAAEAEGLDSGQ